MPLTFLCKTCGADNQAQAAFCRSCGSPLQEIGPDANTGQLATNVIVKQRYRILKRIGRGGMGAVYKAEDAQLGHRLVALKEMRQSGMTAEEVQRATDAFRQEATMLARLQHPNLPSIFDHFEEDGRWYLVMSFLEGESLADYLSQKLQNKLSVNEVLQIAIQLCTVLGYLHQQQPASIIFRDLKPANIMHTLDGHIYLIDFGIARHFKPDQVRDTAYYASAGYAPPEQYGQAQTTPRSDLYSLGVVLHQMLSGHNPSTTPFRLPSLLAQSPLIPGQLATLISQMLDPDPQKRPANVLVVRQILQDLVSAPTRVPPPPPPTPTLAARRPPPPPPGYIPPVGAERSPQVLQPGYQLPAGNPTSYPPVFPARPPRRKAGWIILSVCIVGIVIVAGGWIFSIVLSHGGPSYPHLASSYQGMMQNTTIGGSTTFTLTIIQDQQLISGRETLSPGLLVGSGPLSGTVGTDNSIHFTVTSDDGSNAVTTFTGTVSQNTLSGTYSVSATYPGLGSQTQTGTWEASATTT